MPFFTLISVAGVALGVALMLVTTSVMGGFGHQIKKMIIDTQGEIQVRGSAPLENLAAVDKALAASLAVAAAAPFAAGVVMLEYQSRPAFPAIQGYDIERMRQVRCPACNRLAAEAAPGSRLRVKCGRCGRMFEFDA